MVFKRLRQSAEEWCKRYRFCSELGLYELVSCEWCNSIWIGAALTLLYVWLGDTILYIALPLAFSTVAIVIKYVVQLLQAAHQYFENTNKLQEYEHREDILIHR
jgi:hypothetical protein